MTKWQKFFAFLVVVAVAFFGYRIVVNYQLTRDLAEKGASPQGRLPDNIEPRSYDLTLRIDPSQSHFSGVAKINLEIKKPVKEIWLHGKDLEPSVVNLNTNEGPIALSYHEMGHSGVVRLTARNTIVPQDAQLEIHYSAPIGTQLLGLYKVEENDQSYVFSQFEPVDARRAFPSFDEPRFKVPYDIKLEVKTSHKGFSNTPQINQAELDNGFKRLTFATTKPLPSYLIAFAVGDFDVVEHTPIAANEIRRFELPLRGIAVKGKGAQLQFALDNTERMLTYLERYFATPYPFEKVDLVAVPDFAAGGMENAGLITYREQRLLMSEMPTYSEQRNFAAIHAHELAHQWFGNLVTMPWWDDIWLNESFATWMGNRAANAWNESFEFDRQLVRSGHSVMAEDALASARQVREPVDNNDVILNAFDGITYAKGGAVLQMLERFIGEDIFRQGVQLHMRRFAYGHADAYDFIDSMTRVSDKPELKEAFFSFLSQAGVPTVSLKWHCQQQRVEISVSQQRYLPLGIDDKSPKVWHLPVCMTLVSANEAPRAICQMINQAEQVIDTTGSCPITIMPNNEGSGYYRFSLDKVQWQYLLNNLKDMTPSEQYSVADNLAAAFRAGDIDADYYLEAIKPFTEAGDWDLITSPIDELIFITDYIAQGKEHEKLSAYLNMLYQPLLEQLGLEPNTSMDKAKPVATALLRKNIVNFMALRAKAPNLRQALLAKAKTYIGYPDGQTMAPEVLNDDLLRAALTVAIEELGRDFFDVLKERVESSSDAMFRQQGMLALGATTEPELADEVRSMALSIGIKDNERVYLIQSQLLRQENVDDVYRWLKSYFSVLVNVLPEQVIAYTPLVGRGFCDRADAEDLQAFFTTNASHILGLKRNLNMTLERINSCVAIKEAQQGLFQSGSLTIR